MMLAVTLFDVYAQLHIIAQMHTLSISGVTGTGPQTVLNRAFCLLKHFLFIVFEELGLLIIVVNMFKKLMQDVIVTELCPRVQNMRVRKTERK